MSNKLDPKNYHRHSKVMIARDFQKIEGILFTTNLLLIKWQLFGAIPGIKKEDEKLSYEGVIRIAPVNTPIGRLAPTDYKFNAFRKTYSQFLEVGQPDIEYEIEIKNPKGIIKTEIEVWEYRGESITYSHSQIVNSSPSPVIS